MNAKGEMMVWKIERKERETVIGTSPETILVGIPNDGDPEFSFGVAWTSFAPHIPGDESEGMKSALHAVIVGERCKTPLSAK